VANDNSKSINPAFMKKTMMEQRRTQAALADVYRR
jgi:hypothetical protein